MIKKFAQTLDYDIPEELKPYVIAAIYGDTKEKVRVTIPALPNGFPMLIHVFGDLPILHVNDSTRLATSTLNLAGQIKGTIPKMEINGRFGQNGFLLHPLAPYYLFHIRGMDFLNQWMPLKSIIKYNWKPLIEKLELCDNSLERVALLANMMIDLEAKRLPSIPWLDSSIASIYDVQGNISVNKLAVSAGIGARHFRRKFREIVGVPPKYFCKVVQLNSVFEVLNQSENESLLKLALDHGYYDQAHFIHDFKKIIGDSPERFLMSKDAYVKEYLGNKGY